MPLLARIPRGSSRARAFASYFGPGRRRRYFCRGRVCPVVRVGTKLLKLARL